jgi:citrate lyase beta subunit
VERAEKIVRAFRELQAGGTGAFAFEGKMVDMPVVRAAEAVLARAGVQI